MTLRIEWDPRKASSNLRKHGIAFTEAATVFADPLSLTIEDPEHSLGENRFIIIGQSHRGRTVIVSHMEQGDTIRIISARMAAKREKRAYEEI